MRLSRYFLPILKETPHDAQIASHRLMLRAGMIHQTTSGIYSWLPLGLKVLKNIENIIEDGQNSIGCNRITMPTIQPAHLWQESGRYDDYGKEMLRMKDRHDRDMLYGPTHEEVITDLARGCIKSYKHLPQILYQIHWKFRDEIRPRFGVMRAREFYMKDGYSFDIDAKSARETYKKIYENYLTIFKNMGLKAIPVKADTGAIGGDLSHEFQIVAPTGESTIYYDEAFDTISDANRNFDTLNNLYAAADEMHSEENCPTPKDKLKSARGIEIGHIFYFGKKYSQSMNFTVIGQDGKPIHPEMGSYGIGVSRLVGAIIEANHDDNGIIWPESVAPFHISLINAKPSDEATTKLSDDLYAKLTHSGIEVLYDDTASRAGAKFATADIIGSPYHIIVGRDATENGLYELKDRRTKDRTSLTFSQIMEKFTAKTVAK
ncbi:MAG: proline--tRNA ligase [Alphaproteobacteria bacterium CG_4_10_14_0_8_um_filter_37_21]|nr:MAG: proline--tRNA ligase [Alphaproteobacteria bacterium CG_4_10_14_0_8_um_filter_37_21]